MKDSENLMSIKPIYDRVLLLIDDGQCETKSGIILPTAAQEKSQTATVVEVGNGITPDGKEVEMFVKKGDRVIFAKYSGTEVNMNERKYVIVRQCDILGIIS